MRSALTTKLQARDALATCAVNLSDPLDADDTGEFQDAIWFADAEGSTEVAFLAGGQPLVFDEDYTATVVCQSLPNADEQTGDRTESQATADARVSALLAEVIATVAIDPTLELGPNADIDDGPFPWFQIDAYSWRFTGGYMPGTNAYAARIELDLHVRARITNEESP